MKHHILLSSDASGAIVAILMILLLVGIIVLSLRYMRKRTIRNWDYFVSMASRFNIQVEKPSVGYFFQPMPRFSGSYKTVGIDILTERRSSGKNTYYYTILNIHMNGAEGFELKLAKEGFFQKIGKALGMQDIATGHEEFDRKFVLKSNDENRARQIFDFQFCNEILAAEPMIRSAIRLRNNHFHYEEQLVITSDETLERMVAVTNTIIRLAEKINGGGGRARY